MLFILRLIKHLAIQLLLLWPLQLIGAILLIPYIFLTSAPKPGAPLEDFRLPAWLRWFDNADIYPQSGRDSSTYRKVASGPKYGRYTWLAWRNPINYFSYFYLGIEPCIHVNLIEHRTTQPTPIGDGIDHHGGHMYVFYLMDGQPAYEYYSVIPYTLFGMRLCVRFRMGHKFGGPDQARGEWVQEVFVFNPVQPYEGR